MGRWSRQELEEAYEEYQRVSLEAFRSGNFDLWVDLFTEDCTYVEHFFGTLVAVRLSKGSLPWQMARTQRPR